MTSHLTCDSDSADCFCHCLSWQSISNVFLNSNRMSDLVFSNTNNRSICCMFCLALPPPWINYCSCSLVLVWIQNKDATRWSWNHFQDLGTVVFTFRVSAVSWCSLLLLSRLTGKKRAAASLQANGVEDWTSLKGRKRWHDLATVLIDR